MDEWREGSHHHRWSSVSSVQEAKLGAVEVSEALRSANKVKSISHKAASTLNTTLPCGSMFIL